MHPHAFSSQCFRPMNFAFFVAIFAMCHRVKSSTRAMISTNHLPYDVWNSFLFVNNHNSNNKKALALFRVRPHRKARNGARAKLATLCKIPVSWGVVFRQRANLPPALRVVNKKFELFSPALVCLKIEFSQREGLCYSDASLDAGKYLFLLRLRYDRSHPPLNCQNKAVHFWMVFNRFNRGSR